MLKMKVGGLHYIWLVCKFIIDCTLFIRYLGYILVSHPANIKILMPPHNILLVKAVKFKCIIEITIHPQ